MKTVIALLLFLGLVCTSTQAADQVSEKKKPYIRYAEFQQDTRVDLSDGAVWMMEKGDCFPIHMFKDQQTKVVLKLASATFQTDMANLKVLEESQNGRALESYRKNLNQYLNGRSDAWKKETGVAADKK